MRDAAETLERELRWFYAVLEARLRAHFAAADAPAAGEPPRAPDLARAAGPYAALVRTHGFGAEERLVLALALAPHVRPALLDPLFTRNSTYDRPFSEFGGLGQPGGAFTPSVETALFLLAGESLADRLRAARFFAAEHPFQRAGLLDLGPADPALTPAQRPLRPAPAALHTLLTGEPWRPRFGLQFPARRLTTERTWDDLVLTPDTREQLDDILAWLRHGDTILRGWGLGKKLRPGWRALFVGQPGTGKTFTATLLGQAAGRDVYRVDLSMVISKYIGETEKNLEAVFSQAEDRDWILFFDEADALFGRRTQVKDAHDRFANQEVSYLLQRVEEFPGVVVLATNFRDNLDDAFLRRFESVVQFPLPGPEELHVLWRHGLAGVGELAPDVDLAGLARRHRLSGGAVMNVVRFCALRAVRRERPVVRLRDLEDGLRRELQKEGRSC